jgi:23S rRNA pseudouridine2605 synthase
VIRLQKFLADAGVASRRAAEQIILEGRVAVNGAVVRVLGSKMDPAHDNVTVDGKPVKAHKKHYIVRLDFASEGLLFLTNDGDFALKLTHPRYGVRKRYVVTVEGKVDGEVLDRFTNGIFHDGEKLKAERAWLLTANKSESVVELELAEGKNREVRRLFESQGYLVRRLVRTQIGKVKLAELKPGKWRTLTPTEIKTLLPEL